MSEAKQKKISIFFIIFHRHEKKTEQTDNLTSDNPAKEREINDKVLQTP